MTKEMKKKHKDFIDAFQKSAGNVSQACTKVDISRETYYRWCDEYDTFKKASDDVKEGLLDFAESQLMKNIKDGKETSLIFFLKTRGKKRGFVEKTELEVHGDGLVNKIEIEVIKKK